MKEMSTESVKMHGKERIGPAISQVKDRQAKENNENPSGGPTVETLCDNG